MTTYLGVDAGGTRTTAILARDDRPIARAVGGPGAIRPGRALVAAARIAGTARRALTEAGLLQADVLVVGAAGAGRDPERTELREGLRAERLAERVMVVGDLEIALVAAFGTGPGAVLISGTGSVVVGRTADGIVHRRGGYGWQMGDEGGGYAIGRAALLAIGQAHDGRAPATALTEAILAATPARTFDDLVRWSGTAEPSELAALARVVFRIAEQGDPVARRIVEAAADDLVQLAGSLLAVFPPRKPVGLALAGGNLAEGRGLRAPVLARLGKLSRYTVRPEAVEAAEGALAMARGAPTPSPAGSSGSHKGNR
jgi:glucosamine kinase